MNTQRGEEHLHLGGQEALPGIVNGSGTSHIFGAEIPDVFTTSHPDDDGKGRHGEGEMTLEGMEKHHMMMMHRPHEQHPLHHHHHDHHHHHVLGHQQEHADMGMIRMLGEEETAALAADLAAFEKRTQSTTEEGDPNEEATTTRKRDIHQNDAGEKTEGDGGVSRPPPQQKRKRGGYTWWWKEGVIENILEFVKEKKSYFKAVKELKASEYNADGKYNKLSSSTVESWFVKGSYEELKDKYKVHHERLERSTRPGQTTTLGRYPGLEKAVYDIIKEGIDRASVEMTDFDSKGVQAQVLRLVENQHPELLKVNGGKLTLSMKFIKRFCQRYFADRYPFPVKKRQSEFDSDDPVDQNAMNNALSSE